MSGIKISSLPASAGAALTDVYPVVQAGVTNKESVSQLVTLLDANLSFLPLSGGTLTGNLILNSDAATGLGAVTLNQLNAVATGITVQGAARLATTGALTVTYSNGTAGVGATLTNAGAQAALTLDGVAAVLNDRILVKNQAASAQNGIYTVTAIGSGSANWVLTRATDYDLPSQINPGDLVVVTAGTTLASSSWLMTSPQVVTIGTNPITFAQFSAALPISVPNGGTALTSTTINQILYSSANNVISGLPTANNGVLVTNSSGVPSISVSGLPSTAVATKSDQLAATSLVLAVTPGTQQFHPSAVKVWAAILGSSGAINVSYNVAAVIRNSTGNYTISFTTPFSSANYAINLGCSGTATVLIPTVVASPTASVLSVQVYNQLGSATDPVVLYISCFGAE